MNAVGSSRKSSAILILAWMAMGRVTCTLGECKKKSLNLLAVTLDTASRMPPRAANATVRATEAPKPMYVSCSGPLNRSIDRTIS